MSLFHYPKRRQVRALKPPQYKNYSTYKRWLQAEFRRVCVYCRQPDSGAFGLFFTVDHYRPKGLPQFAPLAVTYANLFYCCPACNSRKNNYWPKDEAKGPLIPNPCDHNMAEHLRHADGEVTSAGIAEAMTLQ